MPRSRFQTKPNDRTAGTELVGLICSLLGWDVGGHRVLNKHTVLARLGVIR